MEYTVTTKDKEFIVKADDYNDMGDYIDFITINGLFTRSVALFKKDDIIRIIGVKEDDEGKHEKE